MIKKARFSLSLILLLLVATDAHALDFSKLKEGFSKAKELAGKAKEVLNSDQFKGALDAGKGLLAGLGGGGGSEPPCPRTCPAEQAQQQREIQGIQSQIARDERTLLAGNQNYYQRQKTADTVLGRQGAQGGGSGGGLGGVSQGLQKLGGNNSGGGLLGSLGGIKQRLQNLAGNNSVGGSLGSLGGIKQRLQNLAGNNSGGGSLGSFGRIKQRLQNLTSNNGGRLLSSFRKSNNNSRQKISLKQRLSTAKGMLQKFKMKLSGQTGG